MDFGYMIYEGPRPFWISPEIKGYGRSVGMGHPSGHSMLCMAMPMTIWWDLYKNCDLFSKLLKCVIGVMTVAFGAMIAYSRLLLGVHSLDQVTFGCLIGLWIAYTMQWCVRPYLDRHVR